MRISIVCFGGILLGLLLIPCEVDGRGFGGFRGGYGGFDRSSFDRGSYGSFDRGSSGGYRSDDFSSYRGGYGGSSYDRSYEGARGGSYSASGSRGAVISPWGGAAGRTRDVTATGPEGRTYSADRSSATAFTRFPTDAGFAHYSSGAITGVRGGTAYWSHGTIAARGGYIRTGWPYYHSFTGAWWGAHPAAWRPAAWTVAGAAWVPATWSALALGCGIVEPPVYYDYGNTIVYQGDTVYVNGTGAGTQQQYAQQAATLAAQGQQANPPATAQWQALGVFALVQGNEQSSNTMFQLAVDPNGTIRGNYFDGLMDTTTPIYGSVDKKTQRAAWYIGDKKTTVFETGFDNLTQEQTPVLVHFGNDRTQQWLLVRMQQPKTGQ